MIDGFYIGPLKIYFYGIIIMAGVLAAVALVYKEAQRKGYDVNHIWDLLPWLLILGIVGARLWHVFTPSQSMGVTAAYYFTHPLEILNTRNGGLGIPGAVIGGFLGLYIYTRKHKLDLLAWADLIAPGLALAQAVGRWGNFINQELYGSPSTLPWAIYIDPAHRMAGYENFATYHPMFLYESLWNLFNMFVLLYITRKNTERMIPGDVFLTYLVIYPVGRFALEFIRLDPSFIGGFNANQIVMAVVAISAVILLLIRHRKPHEINTPEN